MAHTKAAMGGSDRPAIDTAVRKVDQGVPGSPIPLFGEESQASTGTKIAFLKCYPELKEAQDSEIREARETIRRAREDGCP